MNRSECVVLLSGGMDSVALAHWATRLDGAKYWKPVMAVGLDYGQPHRRELDVAESVANGLGLSWKALRVDGLAGGILDGQDSGERDGVALAFVPGRNAVFVTLAAAYAAGIGVNAVLLGCNRDDEAFPDCSMSFVHGCNGLLRTAGVHVGVFAPWQTYRKAAIATWARRDDAAWRDVVQSWSCYRGGDVPCGECGACVKRAAALDEAHRAI